MSAMMFQVLTCLTLEHDYRFVMLATVLCFLSCLVSMVLLRRARQTSGRALWFWLATAGTAGGFGIWGTHFIAILGYDPGVVIGYKLTPTLASLALAIAATCSSLACATRLVGRSAFIGAGILFGAGVAGMHFLGMTAIDLPGAVSWDFNLVAASIAMGILFAVGAFRYALRSESDPKGALMPTVLLVLSVVALHFTAMGSVTVVPDGSVGAAGLLSPPLMATTIAAISFSLLASGLTASMFAMRAESMKKADADRIRRVSHNLDVALENMSQGICLFDSDERLVLFNRRYSEIFGFPDGMIQPGLPYREIAMAAHRFFWPEPEEHGPRAAEHYDRTMSIVRGGTGTAVLSLPDGRSIQANCNAMQDGGWVATFEDITERLRSEERIAFMARHDGLTGLPNRAEFNEHLAHWIVVAKRTDSRLAVIGIDLDGFKEINDEHGHAAGDRVLIALGERMSGVLRDEELVARFGGDEFAAFKRFDDMSELHDFLARLRACLTGAVTMDGYEIRPGASMGVALYPQDAETAELLLANADLAMYRAKTALQEDTCFYEVAMDEAVRSRNGLARDLWSAIGSKQFHLHYQVQQCVHTGATIGYEVLLRWTHPERGNIPPADFIPLAEECGAILPIGEWVLREACREASTWRDPHRIAVNLSPLQLSHADMAGLVRSVLHETGLEAGRLELEITESSIIADKEQALRILREIKSLGAAVAIDDFGTGYSSLETLRSFPFDKIKLDRTFMAEIEMDPQAKAILRAILALGRSLNVPVLAEGVETQVQLDILLTEGCDEAQGYYLGRPRPIRDLIDEEGMPVIAAAAAA